MGTGTSGHVPHKLVDPSLLSSLEPWGTAQVKLRANTQLRGLLDHHG